LHRVSSAKAVVEDKIIPVKRIFINCDVLNLYSIKNYSEFESIFVYIDKIY